MSEPVKVNVFLNEATVPCITNLTGAFATTRKDLIGWIADSYLYLYLEDFRAELDAQPAAKVQAEVNPDFLIEATKALCTAEKYIATSAVVNQLLTAPLIDGAALGVPEPYVATTLTEALRWFRFGPALGFSAADPIVVTSAQLLRLERIPPPGDYRCYGIFTSPMCADTRLGFRGTIHSGELQLDLVLPVPIN